MKRPIAPGIEGAYSPLVRLPVKLRVSDVRDHVAKYFRLSVEDLCGPRRTRDLVRPRQTAMYLARKLTGRSTPQIGKVFGNRDHTTVMHAVKQIERLVGGECEDLAFVVPKLQCELSARFRFNPLVTPVYPVIAGE
jgi:chromosomal replication initiator protein